VRTTAELFREPGKTYLSPTRFASTLEVDLPTLANALGVHVNTMRLHPASARTQDRLRDYARVFTSLVSVNSDLKSTAFHMKNTPIRVLGHRTLFEAVRDGDTAKAMRYLDTISFGQN
jgi:hypothetical protein